MIYRIVILIFSLLILSSCNDKKIKHETTIKISHKELKDFLFAGMIEDKEGLYKYNFTKKSSEVFWSDKKERVAELSYSENKKNVFFITAEDFGKAGGFPFINNVKLYLINSETEKVNLIEKILSGLQVFTKWENENSFRIIINSADKTMSNYVHQRRILFNIFGKKLEDITETYDITKQGYPQPPGKKINFISPMQECSIEGRGIDTIAVHLKKYEEEKLIVRSNQQIKQVEWKNNFLIISTININPDNESLYSDNPETSKLIIYSLKQDEILKMWESSGVKNFFIADGFVVFDDGFGKDSRIFIYNLKNKKIYDEIKITGGCGLRNVPEIPDYGA